MFSLLFTGCFQHAQMTGQDPFVQLRTSKVKKITMELKSRRIKLETCQKKVAILKKGSIEKVKLCKKPILQKSSFSVPFILGFAVGGLAVGLIVGAVAKNLQ